MAENFDGYHKWLGIPPEDQPPNHYQLLGVRLFEDDRDVISNAVDQRMRHVRTFQGGKHSDLSQQILNELSSARLCLLRPDKKSAYDQTLREKQSARPSLSVAAVPPPPAASAGFDAAGFEAAAANAGAVQTDFATEFYDPNATQRKPAPASRKLAPARRAKPKTIQPWQIGAAAAVGIILVLGVAFAVMSQQETPPIAKKPIEAKLLDSKPADPKLSGPTIPGPAKPDPKTGDVHSSPTDPVIPAASKPEKTPKVETGEPSPVKTAKVDPSKPKPGDDPKVPDYEKRPDLSHEAVVKPPPAPTDFTPDQLKHFGDSISTARVELAKLDIGKARAALDKAAQVVAADARMPDKQYEELNRLRNLAAMLQTGLDDLHKGLNDLPVGEEIDVELKGLGKGTVAARDKNALIVTAAGHPDRVTLRFNDISPALAERIENKTFKFRSTESTAGLAAFHTLSPLGDRKEAKKLFDKAAASGLDVKNVLAELSAKPPAKSPPKNPVKPPVEAKPPGDAVVETGKKLPVPSDESLQKSRASINELFAGDLAKAKKPEDKAALAATLATKARETTDNPSDRYALWTMARDVAADAGDAAAMMQAIDGLTFDYDIDALEMKTEAMSRAAKATVTSAPAKDLCEKVLALISEAVAADNFTAAGKLIAVASTLSGRAKDADLGKALGAARKEVADLQKVADAAKKAAETLKQTPDDPDANLALGLHLCFAKDDWEHGLPHLAKGNNEDLKAIVKVELTKPTDANAQADLGDLWWALGDKSPAASKLSYEKRAGFWYEKAQPQITGLASVKLAKRLKQLEDAAASETGGGIAGAKPKAVRKTGVEVHMIGFTGDATTPSVASIKVTQTDKAIILVLMGENSIEWNIEVGPQVLLKGIFCSGRHPQKVNAPKNVPIAVEYQRGKRFYVDSEDSPSYSRVVDKVTTLTGMAPSSFHGGNTPPATPIVIGPAR